MTRFVIDTHALLMWLKTPKKLGRESLKMLGDDDRTLIVPTMVALEIQFLYEIGRLDGIASDIFRTLESLANFSFVDFSFECFMKSVELSDSRDPFDRTILATAMALEVPIVSRDRWMAERYDKVIW